MTALHHLRMVVGYRREGLAGACQRRREHERHRQEDHQELLNAHCEGICAHQRRLSTFLDRRGSNDFSRVGKQERVRVSNRKLDECRV